MISSNPPTCAECGKPVPTDSQHQICPACLMAQAMASRTVESDSAAASAPPPSPGEIADKFPQFEITECLGRGGMGVVYKARQKSLNRWVAIKILAPEKIHDEKFAERFTREAHTLALLNHPNIVTVYDHGETEGLYYIVMEFVDGVNLRDLLRDGKMEPAQALTIIPPICEALQYAHDKGIVHRDIKPENLLIDRDGRVKIADFGIASLVGASDEKSGTPPYMAPEQGAHSHVDHRADIYALGAVLYEMLTGDRPASPLDLPSQKVQLDIRIDDIVLRALSKEPERRYRTANEFRTVVENVTPQKAATDQAAQAPISTPSPGLDPRFARILGIIIIVAGALNGLSTLASLLILPFIRRIASLETNQFLSPFFSGPSMSPLQASHGGLIAIAFIAFSALITLAVSTFCIFGGRHMYLGTSRKWALTGAIACCLTTLFWPLGLLVGVGAIVIWVLEKDSSHTANRQGYSQAPAKEGPRLSILAVPFILCALVLRFATFSFGLDDTALLIMVPVFATGLIFSIKFSQALYRGVIKGDAILPGFLSRLNRITGIAVVLIWLVFGGLYAASLIHTVKPPTSPMEEPSAEAASTSSALSFQPEHEMTIPYPRSGSRTSFLDLDRRDFIEAPSDIHSLAKNRFNPSASKPPNADKRIEEWASSCGADLMIVQIKPKVLTALYGGPMAHRPSLGFDTSTPMQILEAAESLPQAPPAGADRPYVTLFDTDPNEPIIFRTREGGIGLLELRESQELPKGGLVVRYKTIKPSEEYRPGGR